MNLIKLSKIDRQYDGFQTSYLEKKKKIIMQINLISLFVLLALMQVYGKGHSQVSLREKNTSLEKIFRSIENQSGYVFFYNDEDVKNARVSVLVNNVTIEKALQEIFKDLSLTFKINQRDILIGKTDEKAVVSYRQRILVEGIVMDDFNRPLVGATIKVKGTNITTLTNNIGEFSLKDINENAVLVVSFMGYETAEVAVSNKVKKIILKALTSQLDQVEVVNTGYQKLPKERLTGSFGVLNSQEINRTLTPDFISRIEGKIAGVQVRGGAITIRGEGSIISNTSPLVVVDGFPIEGGLSTVNPDDIENVTVLKDAAAASIWGVRAANGVIVITTKKGLRNGRNLFEVFNILTVSAKSDFKDLHLMNATQSIDHMIDNIGIGNTNVNYVNDYHEALNRVEEAYYETRLNMPNADHETIISNTEFRNKMEQLRNANFQKQFSDYLMRNSILNRLNVTLSGGGEKSDYYLSGLYNYNKGEMIGNKDDEIVVNFKHNYTLRDNLIFSTGINANYNHGKQNGISLYSATYEMPYHNLVDDAGTRIRYWMIDKWEGRRREEMGYLSYSSNLLEEQEMNDIEHIGFSTRIQTALDYRIIDGLNIETRFQYERGFNKRENFQRASHPAMRQIINSFTLINSDGSLNLQFPLGGMFDVSNSHSEAWTWRNQLNFEKSFRDNRHQLVSVLGHEVRSYGSKSNQTIKYGFDENSLSYIPVNEDFLRRGEYLGWVGWSPYSFGAFNSYSEGDNRDFSLYSNGAYTFKGRYTASFSGRMDQSNVFGNDSKYRYNIIWSSGLSWNIREEAFISAPWLNQLLLRATYGLGGNINKSFYPVLMGSNELDYWTGVSYINLTNPANNTLKWETAKTYNLGLDFKIINHRYSGSVDLYHKKGVDLLGRVTIDPTNGFSAATMNFASVLNKGVELTFNAIPVKRDKISWSVGMNISYNNNNVIKVDDQGISAQQYLQPRPPGRGSAIMGKALSRMYSYQYAGLDNKGEPMLWEKGKKVSWDDYSENKDDLVYVGVADAPYFGGMNTSLRYSNFTFSAQAIYEFGHKFRKPASDPKYGVYTDVADRWRQPGDENHTNVPLLTSDYWVSSAVGNYYKFADTHIRDASYIKLSEVSLSYALPQGVMGKSVNDVSITFQARNLYQWNANKENINPQSVNMSAYSGMTDYGYNQPSSLIFGIKARF
ncbi:SusC/RagA family TonB-linked outer membrane protein [Sphingobacterium sp. xlx-130]|uniref:SusC/RagA family TonB-linked outer membrane protein n=1 Tax=Sphingobacterium sp. xlx-130 TaxID=2654323 RepID=UPI0013DAE554|nr:SusC/RagA family TonB-linked outer membrane protein [Sphingobacterium sp. xlx-130]